MQSPAAKSLRHHVHLCQQNQSLYYLSIYECKERQLQILSSYQRWQSVTHQRDVRPALLAQGEKCTRLQMQDERDCTSERE